MCYSAMVEQDLKKHGMKWSVRTDLDLIESIFDRRAKGEKIELGRGFEANFLLPESPQEKKILESIKSFRSAQIQELETKLFEQKKKLADAERKLESKHTKTAENAKAVAERQIERFKNRLGRLQAKDVTESDSRIYAMNWAPVIVWKDEERSLVPMRYHLRPPGMQENFDAKYPGCYNARRDSLTGFWRKEFGKRHGVLVISAFYENVKRHDYENRKLKPGEEEENMILKFSPKGSEYMYVPCIWDHWEGKDGKGFDSFALITDEPPPEISAAGHDRCPVFLKEENINAWLQPKGKSDEELFALLDDRQRPYYEHSVAA